MRVVFTLAAETELMEARQRYDQQRPGLGRRFENEIERVVKRLSQSPLQFPEIGKSVRRAMIRDFPYSLLFQISDQSLLVIACFHASRDPRVWQSRV